MKVLIMGCGGIGSWLCQFIAFGIRNHTIDIDVTVADGDVVEAKNLLYSSFDIMDVGKNKAEALSQSYGFKPIDRDIQADDLNGYDLVIVATDDGKSRKMVYDSEVDWIDLRSKGRGYAVFAKGARPQEDMLDTLDIERRRESCQEDHRLSERKIDAGNVIAAAMGYQLLLNHLRREMTVKEMRGYL
jgi:hypothetical protein